MKIIRLSALANDLEAAYDDLKKALTYLDQNNKAKTKNEINKAIKRLEQERPHLKVKGRPVRRKY